MKTSKQQLLAMLRHRLLPERSRRATRWHVLMLMLALLIGGSPQAWAQEYITEVMVLGVSGGLNAKNLRNEYTNKGWTVVEQDLNEGTGGLWVHIAYKTSSTANPYSGYITDICASNYSMDKFTYDGRTYYKAPTNSGFNGDLNKGSGVFPDIYIFHPRPQEP